MKRETKGQGPRATGQGSGTRDQGSGLRGQGFRALLAWQRAHALALAVFRETTPLQRSNAWLVRQCTRSAVSVPANIAEGFSRASLRDYIRYLNIARGSLAETEYYLIFLDDAKLLPAQTIGKLEALRVEAGGLLVGLLRSLQAKERGESQPRVRIGEEQPEYVAEPDPRDVGLGPWPLALGPAGTKQAKARPRARRVS